MKNAASTTNESSETQVHPLQKSYMFVSTKHVDYENITAFEAVAMSTVLVLSVIIGVLQTAVLA